MYSTEKHYPQKNYTFRKVSHKQIPCTPSSVKPELKALPFMQTQTVYSILREGWISRGLGIVFLIREGGWRISHIKSVSTGEVFHVQHMHRRTENRSGLFGFKIKLVQ